MEMRNHTTNYPQNRYSSVLKENVQAPIHQMLHTKHEGLPTRPDMSGSGYRRSPTEVSRADSYSTDYTYSRDVPSPQTLDRNRMYRMTEYDEEYPILGKGRRYQTSERKGVETTSALQTPDDTRNRQLSAENTFKLTESGQDAKKPPSSLSPQALQLLELMASQMFKS